LRTQVATVQATLPPLRQALEQTQTQLAVYLGQFPSTAELSAVNLDALTLPHDIPVSLPSTLTRQRPDVRAAEAQLHSATADVGIATANLFPQITLTGNLGSIALHTGDLFGGGTKAWGIGGNLLAPLFHGGTLRAQERAAEAGLDKAAADYQSTVLTAFQNVADSLRALELDADSLQAQATAENSAGASLELVRFQYRNGSASYLQVLDATRQFQQARIGLIQARAARLADTAALYAALGGGWREDDARKVAIAAPPPE
jgi:NodT family efflux transporter outer membrane factor (OMF) lipoprotein